MLILLKTNISDIKNGWKLFMFSDIFNISY